MIDRYGRELTYLRVSLIDRCNLRCFYCMPKGRQEAFGADELLTDDEIVRAVSLFAGLGMWKVRLTGGEPLLRRGVPELVARIRRIPGIRQIVMTSNGLLLSAFARKLKAAGLDRINISLDTLDRENFRRITGLDRLEDVLRGIESAREAGLGPIKLNTVLMKGYNDGELGRLLGFAIERGLQLRFIEWMPTAGEIYSARNDRYFSCEAARSILEREYRLSEGPGDAHAPARSYRIEGTACTVGFISPLSNAFCPSCNRLRLKANGMMKTCLHGREDLDLKALLRSGASDERLRDEVASVVFDRPKEHYLNDAAVTHKDFVMTAVGG